MRGGSAVPHFPKESAMPPVIDKNTCIRCGNCADVCPLEVFGWKPGKGELPQVRYPDECWHCNVCVLDCPANAITLRVPVSHMVLHLDSPALKTMEGGK